ncbi:hypothetical protein NM208_g14838 [Fusarium decemcellulare]|uniref:Uncharacterized protein n=1 Tax=Fusarium decemcellulare TaxID=57161 RepID=A0ACC1REV3_9HYPO|nr:hypothetical protein NM208_g14838 [Fusarium decemcellulare]
MEKQPTSLWVAVATGRLEETRGGREPGRYPALAGWCKYVPLLGAVLRFQCCCVDVVFINIDQQALPTHHCMKVRGWPQGLPAFWPASCLPYLTLVVASRLFWGPSCHPFPSPSLQLCPASREFGRCCFPSSTPHAQALCGLAYPSAPKTQEDVVPLLQMPCTPELPDRRVVYTPSGLLIAAIKQDCLSASNQPGCIHRSSTSSRGAHAKHSSAAACCVLGTALTAALTPTPVDAWRRAWLARMGGIMVIDPLAKGQPLTVLFMHVVVLLHRPFPWALGSGK